MELHPGTERGRILGDARNATEGDRNKSYGDPGDQLGLAGILKEIVRDHMLRDVSPGEMEALDMVLTKVSRAVMGGKPGRDTYVDMAAYAAIAGELAGRDEEDSQAIYRRARRDEREYIPASREEPITAGGMLNAMRSAFGTGAVGHELSEADKARIRGSDHSRFDIDRDDLTRVRRDPFPRVNGHEAWCPAAKYSEGRCLCDQSLPPERREEGIS